MVSSSDKPISIVTATQMRPIKNSTGSSPNLPSHVFPTQSGTRYPMTVNIGSRYRVSQSRQVRKRFLGTQRIREPRQRDEVQGGEQRKKVDNAPPPDDVPDRLHSCGAQLCSIAIFQVSTRGLAVGFCDDDLDLPIRILHRSARPRYDGSISQYQIIDERNPDRAVRDVSVAESSRTRSRVLWGGRSSRH